MLKNVSELKKKLINGTKVKMVYHAYASDTQKEKLFLPRYVVKVQTNGVYFSTDKNATKGSFLEFPKASLVEFNGNAFSIFERGERELNDEEKAVIAGEPKDEKQEEIDALSDGSVMFYRKQRYYREIGMGYLFHDKHASLHYDWNTQKIDSDAIRGKLLMTYEIMESD